MQLCDFLEAEGLTLAEFAARINVRSRMTVWRYAHDGRIPSPKIMPRIVEATGGKVTAADFYAAAAKAA